MRNKQIGPFGMGHQQVVIKLLSGEQGGAFEYPPAIISVGLDHASWEDVVSVLLHESFEMSLARMGCRLEATSKTSGDLGDFTFVMTHSQMSQAAQEVADLVAASLPHIVREWRNVRKLTSK